MEIKKPIKYRPRLNRASYSTVNRVISIRLTDNEYTQLSLIAALKQQTLSETARMLLQKDLSSSN